jgi:adenylate cyclase
MKNYFRISSLLFYGISAFLVVILAICFVHALSWVNKPFPGFLLYKEAFVGSFKSNDWPGIKAGLKFHERIATVDGKPVLEGQDVVNTVRQKAPGTPVHYSVKSKEGTGEVTVPVEVFTVKDFLLVFSVTFLGGLIIYAFGTAVYLLKPDMRPSWVFYLETLWLGTYMVSGFEIQSSYILVRFHYACLCLIPPTLFHFFLIFPDRKRILTRWPFLEYLVYLPSLTIVLGYQIYFSMFREAGGLFWVPTYESLGQAVRISMIFYMIGIVSLVVHALYRAITIQGRQRAKMILFGVTMAFSPPIIIMVLAFFIKFSFPWNFFPFFIIFFPASIAYSIVKHNLFEADAIIKRTVGYVVVTAVIVGAYVLVSIFFNVFLGQYQVSQSRVFPIIFTLIIILIFNPLRNRIQSLVDRIFFRKEYDYGEIIHRIGGAMTSLLDLGQILKQMLRTFMEDMFINTSSVMLLNPATAEYQVYLADGEKKGEIEKVIFRKDQPLMQIIEREKRELTKYDVIEDPKYKAVSQDCAGDFGSVHASLMVPLVFQDEVIGVISLGEKKSGKSYNREDIDLFRTLANQGVVAIKNARLVDQMKSEEAVRANLARYLSPQIVDQVIKKNVQVNLGGDRKIVTVLFSDIRNFTRISESLPPDKLVELLNEYFTEMAKIIFQNQGSLDKYIGDAIVAVFGSLIPLENPGQTAVQAAIQMMKELLSLNERWKNQYGFRMDIGIGINTGDVFLGNIGSPERMEFTVIGDTVNIASRFSDVAKPGQILITQETFANLGPEIKYTELPPVEVKGKTGKLEVFEILY